MQDFLRIADDRGYGATIRVYPSLVQGESAPALFVASGGFTQVRDRRDLTDRPRFVTAVRAGRMVP